MSAETVKVIFNGREISVVIGTRVSELLGRHPHKGELPVLGAIFNKRLTGLYRTVTCDGVLDTIDYHSKQGADIYRRSVCLLLYSTVKSLYPDAKVEVGQSFGTAYFFEIYGVDITANIVKEIEYKMNESVDADEPFVIEKAYVDQTAKYFAKVGADSKANYLCQIPRSEISIVTLGRFTDILHGPVALSTGALKNFRLSKFHHGVLLTFPSRDGETVQPVKETRKNLLFDAYRETREWNEQVGISNVSELNAACIKGTISDLIKVAEALHEKKIGQIADLITNRKKLPKLVMLSGPSSSGKTTTSRRLGVQLRVNGIMPKTISIDNYYVDRDKTPLAPDGTYDFECVEAIDLDCFADHMKRIIAGELVQTPIFDFQTGKRRADKFIPIQLADNEILIIEGIHALNDRLHGKVAKEDKFGIFVSALTQLCIDEHNRIFTSDTRLLRRIVRDRVYRGYSASDTIRRFPSVREGEDKYIFPFQDQADVMFNSALVYEQAVMKVYAKRFLLEVEQQDDSYAEAIRLIHFLDHFIPVLPEEVPPTSLLREFIGGSTFHY